MAVSTALCALAIPSKGAASNRPGACFGGRSPQSLCDPWEMIIDVPSCSASGMAQLSQNEVDACRQLFAQYGRNGIVALDDLSGMLSALGFGADDVVSAQSRMVDMDSNEGLDIEKFLKIVQSQRDTNIAVVDDTDTVEAFVALGGKADRSGKVLIDKLRNTIKEFELTIDLDTLLSDMDKEQSGSIDFKEFKSLLD